MANIDRFLQLFSEFDLVVTSSGRRTPEEVFESPDIYNPTVNDLKKSIKKLEREYAAAKKAFKHGRIVRDELLDYEWRLFELREELKKIQGDDFL
mgnify:CR=1 FL=1|jgi:hypothetical protein